MTQIKRQEESDTSYFVSYAINCNTSEGGDETALIIDDGFYILNGDWTEEYKKCKSKQEQRELFIKNYEQHAGFWTNSVEDLLSNNTLK